jgi:hypothetical protein
MLPVLERGKGVRRLAVLPELERGIEEQQARDDGEVAPMAEHRGDGGSRLDHVGDRAGEMSEELAGEADLFLGERVRAVLLEPQRHFRGAQPLIRDHVELRQHPRDRQLLEIGGAVGVGQSFGRGRRHAATSLRTRGDLHLGICCCTAMSRCRLARCY